MPSTFTLLDTMPTYVLTCMSVVSFNDSDHQMAISNEKLMKLVCMLNEHTNVLSELVLYLQYVPCKL